MSDLEFFIFFGLPPSRKLFQWVEVIFGFLEGHIWIFWKVLTPPLPPRKLVSTLMLNDATFYEELNFFSKFLSHLRLSWTSYFFPSKFYSYVTVVECWVAGFAARNKMRCQKRRVYYCSQQTLTRLKLPSSY